MMMVRADRNGDHHDDEEEEEKEEKETISSLRERDIPLARPSLAW